jgi:hypothetical protein
MELERHAAGGAHAGTVTTADFGVRRIAGISPDGSEVIVQGAPTRASSMSGASRSPAARRSR